MRIPRNGIQKRHIRPGTFWQRKGDLGVAVQPLDIFSWHFCSPEFSLWRILMVFYALEVAEVL